MATMPLYLILFELTFSDVFISQPLDGTLVLVAAAPVGDPCTHCDLACCNWRRDWALVGARAGGVG
jgi:hypothetical protein